MKNLFFLKRNLLNLCWYSDPADEYKISLDLQAKEIEALVSESEQSSNEIEMLHQLIREESAISIAKANEIEIVRGNLNEIQAKHEETSEKLQNAMERLSKLSARNVNKKLKRRDAMNEKLKDTVKQKEVKIEEKQADLQAQAKSYEDIIDEKNDIIARLNERLDSLHLKLKIRHKN